MIVLDGVWVFSGAGGKFPSAVFRNKDVADKWIKNNSLTGVLTLYPIDQGVYDWAIAKGYFSAKKEHQSSPEFIQTFSSA